MTSQGNLIFYRKILRPYSKEDEVKLLDTEKTKSIVPLDNFLKINSLPFKVSPIFTLKIARIAINSNSYIEAQKRIFNEFGQKISYETIRNLTNLVGELVYNFDCVQADDAIDLYKTKSVDLKDEIDGTIYLEMDGSFINTRTKNKDNSTWGENKLCLIFNSKNLLEYRDKNGEIFYRINNVEYISLFGCVDEFKKHVLALALRNKYNFYRDIVIISDGASWIKSIKDEFFPTAQQILDIYHLYENTSNFLNIIYTDQKKINYYREKWFDLLEQGEWKKVIKDLEKFKDIKTPKGVVNLYNYILNNKDNIDYPVYRLKYKFIGSGAIESGNKYIVQRRLKLSGMRWEKTYAQYLLSLRCKEYSNMWNIVEEIFKSKFLI